jgi:hypothetical protein
MYVIPAVPPRPVPLAASLREIIRQFTPNWFTVTMGTGILALALNQVPSLFRGCIAWPRCCGC